jgi:putative transcriptional regulator
MKSIRESKNLTQEQLANSLGVSRSWIEKVENGKVEPSLKLALRIANFLECSIEDIFFIN